MAILFSNEIMRAVSNELENAKDSVRIITAYCKTSAMDEVCKHISSSVNDKRLMLRFRLDDVIKGSTDFDVVQRCIDDGWKVFIRFDLHAKTYIVDDKRGIIGSANVTGNGLGLKNNGNFEIATLVNIEDEDIMKIDRLFQDAILVEDKVLASLKNQYDKVNPSDRNQTFSWDREILNMFHPHIDTLFSHELPDKEEYCINEYICFIDDVYSNNVDEMREKIRWSNAYIWLLDVLKNNDGCMYFGGLSEKLHNALITDPKPYRKDVKVMLSNLISIIQKVEMPEIIIDRPNYSQRVRLKAENV